METICCCSSAFRDIAGVSVANRQVIKTFSSATELGEMNPAIDFIIIYGVAGSARQDLKFLCISSFSTTKTKLRCFFNYSVGMWILFFMLRPITSS